MKLGALFLVLLILALVAAAVAAILQRRKKLRPGWAILSVLLAGCALLACVFAGSFGSLLVITAGDPAESATGFLTAAAGGDYAAAYAYLEDCESLGLEGAPANASAGALWNALRASYAYELVGEPVRKGVTATQTVRFTSLDLTAVDAQVQAITEEKLRELVQQLPRDEIYDEENNYRPEATAQAYANAVSAVLAEADRYTATAELELTLHYTGGTWKVAVTPALLKALLGGVSY